MDIFRRSGIEGQLEAALDAAGKSWDEYRRGIVKTTNALVASGKVVVPYLTKDSYPQRCEELIGMIQDIGPEQRFIIPYDADIFPRFNVQSLSKKRNLTTAEQFCSAENGNIITSELAVKRALGQLKPEDTHAGIYFKGANQAYRVFTLLDCIRASVASRSIPEDAVGVSIYIDGKVFERGGEAHVVVPSFSSNRKYEFDLLHIPIHNGTIDEAVARTSFEFYSEDTCMRNGYFSIKQGKYTFPVFGSSERNWNARLLDQHTILALKRAKQKIKTEFGYEVIDPFPEPDEELESFFWTLMNNTILEVRENRRIARQPLWETKALVEILLQKYVGCRNKKAQLSSSEL